MKSKLYVTTSIPYVNAEPHIGFALELVQADAIARYGRLTGRRVRFQTGTDEHALKNVLAADRLGLDTQSLVDRNAEKFRQLSASLNVSCDDSTLNQRPVSGDKLTLADKIPRSAAMFLPDTQHRSRMRNERHTPVPKRAASSRQHTSGGPHYEV